MQITDIEALKRAVDANPKLEWREKKTYNWYGRHVGDYAMPKGFTAGDLGKCEFAIGVKGNKNAYEVGVVKRKDGQGFTFLYDFWSGGKGLVEALTGIAYGTATHNPEQDFDQLIREYSLQVSEYEPGIQAFVQQGWQVERLTQPNGDIQLRVYE